ncbi:MAG: glycine cleavage system aminomethyltransferase GcvT [Desulfobacteraceae bacterium]
MTDLLKTVLYQRHIELGARIVEFGGWQMPVQYPMGILAEHLATRSRAGVFDVSHMGRFIIGGSDALGFLQNALTNNAAALEPGQSQYTLLADPHGGAVDDAYLYRFFDEEYLLVVNATNRQIDWNHLDALRSGYKNVTMEDRTRQLAMISLQGPRSKEILAGLLDPRALGEPQRNALATTVYNGHPVWLGRTGYTGEPLCFELFVPTEIAVPIWDALLDLGAQPVGLGARDTLRLEAGLPLYGHELGSDPDGRSIPIFAILLARFAVSFSPLKGDFIGRQALQKQYEALQMIIDNRPGDIGALPRRVRTLEIIDKGIARAGDNVFYQGEPAGRITSGTMVPRWQFHGKGLRSGISDDSHRRAVALALIDSRIPNGGELAVEVRGKRLRAGVMPYLMRSEAPPFARAITWQEYRQSCRTDKPVSPSTADAARHWIRKAVDNTLWRRKQCINLIPSEMTASPQVRMLSIMDPAGRYAEHKAVKAFLDDEIFYYQGTDFIQSVEAALADQMRSYLGCDQVETRPISGQMANMVLFSAMVDFLNRMDRKAEQRRIRKVMNHHIIKGGHLSAQPMGALRDFVMRDPLTERPAVINFPVLTHNPFQIDIDACAALMERHRPELIILGKSMTLHREPVAAIRRLIDDLRLDAVLMYDMAHVLGLAGPHFQQPFAEGADLVTGSTHKTFFGTQRGIVAADFKADQDSRLELWEAITRRAFPGAVSNHHLGTLLGLLAAAMEMNAFKDQYQPAVIANAKAFAKALHAGGLAVAGDAAIDFTETHQVIVEVGYSQGPCIARDLEKNNIICNFQATPHEEGFTASGALRLGVAEMTRFGMQPHDFQTLAQFMADVILRSKDVKQEVLALRQKHMDMQFCFAHKDLDGLFEELQNLLRL